MVLLVKIVSIFFFLEIHTCKTVFVKSYNGELMIYASTQVGNVILLGEIYEVWSSVLKIPRILGERKRNNRCLD